MLSVDLPFLDACKTYHCTDEIRVLVNEVVSYIYESAAVGLIAAAAREQFLRVVAQEQPQRIELARHQWRFR